MFDDISTQSNEMKMYIKRACQLGIMGVGLHRFYPNAMVTRGEFGTVLSRTLWGTKYNIPGNEYYTKHLNALKTNKIINNSNPSLYELRGYVMLMLMRAKQ
ncbi:MAG: S-layer homology domain-containing protein [bacterium]